MKQLIKIDRNGSKHFIEEVSCPRCGGDGTCYIGTMNGRLVPSYVDSGVCFLCRGTGKHLEKTIERTPEYEAKLEAKRIKKQQEESAKIEAEMKAKLEEIELREREEAERKAISKHVGSVGDKINKELIFEFHGQYEKPAFNGFGTETVNVYNLKDEEGNVYVWKTSAYMGMDTEKGWMRPEKGDVIIIKATIKEHSEYRGEKQTVLTRCRCDYSKCTLRY